MNRPAYITKAAQELEDLMTIDPDTPMGRVHKVYASEDREVRNAMHPIMSCVHARLVDKGMTPPRDEVWDPRPEDDTIAGKLDSAIANIKWHRHMAEALLTDPVLIEHGYKAQFEALELKAAQ